MKQRIAVVIPCYKVKEFVLDVITHIGREVSDIYVVDDQCPQETGKYIQKHCEDERVKVLFHAVNQGVGGGLW